MSTAIATPPVANEPVQHFVFGDVGYDQFVAITDAWGERPGLRVSYDGTRLEVMTTSRRQERWKKLLGQLIDLITLTLDIPKKSGGNTTFRNRFVERGVEPDDCFWIQNADGILGVDDWVAGTHPPPDLAIEIIVTRGVVDRQEIYSRLGVTELWTFDGANLTALHRQDDGSHHEVERSIAFPFLEVSQLVPFLTMDSSVGETAIMKQFLAWLESQNFPGAQHS
ncbi:MAG TPA: Uma2 family endonuclease [Caulifigura sp.]|jgi:Uma2 family endonuclease|nr:Uma2 family endonuclease [Caulifigura sp.]